MDFLDEQLALDADFPFRCYQVSDRQALLHRHGYLELNYIESGRGFYVVENRTYPIRPGDIFIINNEERHMAVHEERISMQVIVFDSAMVWSGQEEDAFLKPFFHRNNLFSNRVEACHGDAREIAGYIKRIQEEYAGRKEGWKLVIKAALLLILAVLNRHYEGAKALRQDESRFSRSYERIRVVVEYIGTHYQGHLSLKELAGMAAMNSAYLSTYFKEVMNVTIMDYIESVRLGQACIQLKTTSRQITEIALSCGYNNISYFNRSFRQKMGMTPGEYRKGSGVKKGPGLQDSSEIQK